MKGCWDWELLSFGIRSRTFRGLGYGVQGFGSGLASTHGILLLPTHGILLLPLVSIVVPIFGLTKSIIRILQGNPKKELQWRL